MDGSVNELSKYRVETAEENLDTAKYNLQGGKYKTAVNRAYYAIFHALKAVTVLDGFDSKRHSGVIAYFNEHYVKTGIFDKKISKIIRMAFEIRSNSDYKDFFVISRGETETQIKNTEELINEIKPYLEQRWG